MVVHDHTSLGVGAGAVLLILLLGVSITEAQDLTGSFEQLRTRVVAGDSVTVTDVMGREMRGTIAELSASSLVLLVGKTRTVFVEADVDTVSRRDSRRNGTLWGLGVGGVLGVLLDRSLVKEYGRDDISAGSSASFITTAAGIGAGIGFAVDALMKDQQVIYSRPRKSTRMSAEVFATWSHRRQSISVLLKF